MLDIKSKLVLKILIKECNNGSYKIIESSDIIASMPSRYRVDSDGLDNILCYLERLDCISIKYDDDGVYCLCVMPYGHEVIESENKKGKQKSHFPYLVVILSFLLSFIGAFVGAFITRFL